VRILFTNCSVIFPYLCGIDMAPYYASITSSSIPSLTLDSALLERMQASNTATLESLNERLKSAEEMEGESEISDALRAKANFFTRIGEKEKAIDAQKLALEKTPGLGSRIDIVMTLIRIGFFWGDHVLTTWGLEKAKACVF
jgi:26S proteasome regulatory subunit N7